MRASVQRMFFDPALDCDLQVFAYGELRKDAPVVRHVAHTQHGAAVGGAARNVSSFI